MTIDEIHGALDPEEGEASAEDSFDFADEQEKTEDADEIDHADLLKLYLREASRPPMLTVEGEVEAAKRSERARFRLMKLLSRSLVVAEYCFHLRQAIGRDLETAADYIEAVRIDNNGASVPVGALADPALARCESAYSDLLSQKVPSVGRRSRRRSV